MNPERLKRISLWFAITMAVASVILYFATARIMLENIKITASATTPTNCSTTKHVWTPITSISIYTCEVRRGGDPWSEWE